MYLGMMIIFNYIYIDLSIWLAYDGEEAIFGKKNSKFQFTCRIAYSTRIKSKYT